MPTPMPPLRLVRPRELTGRTVLVILFAFFGTVMTANALLVHYALSTLGGVDTPNAYKVGLAFEGEIEAAARQEARHWQVAEHVERQADGALAITLHPHDEAGAALPGLAVTGVLRHPADARRDRSIVFSEVAPGVYVANDAAAAGSWTLAVDLAKDGQRAFRSENRLVLP